MLEKARKSRFLRDSAILQGSGGVVAGSQLLTSVLLAHQLTSEGQGLYFLALKIYGLYFMLLNVGVASAAVSQIGAAVTRNQKEKVAAWQAFTVKAYALIGILLFAAGYWILPPAVHLFGDGGNPELATWAWWLCLSPVLELGRVLAQITFQGTRKMKYLARLDVGTELGRLALIAFAALVFGTPKAAVLATLGSCLVGSVWGLWLYRSTAKDDQTVPLPTLGAIVRRVREVPLRVGMPLGLRLGFLRSIDALSCDVLPPLFLYFAGVQTQAVEDPESWVAYFIVAQKIMLLPSVLLSGVARTALPTLSGVAGRKDPDAFRRGVFRISLFGGVITLAGLIPVLLLLPIAVWIVYPADYVEPVGLLALILTLGYVIKGFSGVLETFYIVANRLKAALVISTLSMMVAVPLMLFLTLALPKTGAAWGINANFSAVFVHFAYILLFFRRGEHRSLFRDASQVDSGSSGEVPNDPESPGDLEKMDQPLGKA